MTGKKSVKGLLILSVILALFEYGCTSNRFYFKSWNVHTPPEIKKVGVLPFVNESGRRGAGEIVTNTFVTVIFKSKIFQVEEKGNIDRFLTQEKLKTINTISLEQLRRLGERMKIDAVFIGTVEEFTGGDQGERLATPAVTIRVRLVDTRSGRILWTALNRRTGDDYITAFDIGRINSVSSLTKQMLSEVVETIR